MNAVRLAWLLNRQGWPVVSNISLVFGRRIGTVEQLLDTRGSVILLDELQAIVDSRNAIADVQKEITQSAILFGKRGNIVIYTVPNFAMIDVRIRQLTQWLYTCSKVILSTGGATLLTLYWHGGDDRIFKRYGKQLMHHRLYGGLYDTLDEDVRLSSASPVPSRRPRA